MKRLLDRGLTGLLAVAVALVMSGCMSLPTPSAAPADAGSATMERRAAPPAAEFTSSGRDLGGRSSEGELFAAPASEMPAEESFAPSDSASPVAGERDRADSLRASPERSAQYTPVTAGVVDDNEQWSDYLDYRARSDGLWVNDRDVSERHVIRVWDEKAHPVHDATVEIYAGDQAVFTGRTDAGGRLLFHPRALHNARQLQQVSQFRVVARKGQITASELFQRSDDAQWTLALSSPARAERTQLDLMFLIDATGSMSDEIAKLKASMADVADQIAALPEQPDVRYGLAAYRDEGDEYVVRLYGFTDMLAEFQSALASLRADGGGDTPEALNEALHVALHDTAWRADETVRLMILVADAPPHLDYGWQEFSYDTDMIEAVGMGVKILPVGASGLEADGEYIFRQLAQFTGGKFVFLTYEDGDDPGSGPGTETSHDVDNYSVDTLDRLIVRLVSDELAQLSNR